MELRDVLANPDSQGPAPKGTIRQIYADGTVDVDTGTGIASGALVAAWYAPRTGDVVRYVRADAATLLVLGTVRTYNETTVDVDKALTLAWNVDAAAGGGANPLVVTATATKSFRGGDWERDEVYQGAYVPQYGYWRGCYFYGTAPQAIKGRRVTRARIVICRADEGGDIASEAAIVAPHIHTGQPASAPYFTAAAVNIGSSARGTEVEMDLPVAWGQALADGTAKGIGHLYDGTASYSICKSRAQSANTGKLILDWA